MILTDDRVILTPTPKVASVLGFKQWKSWAFHEWIIGKGPEIIGRTE